MFGKRRMRTIILLILLATAASAASAVAGEPPSSSGGSEDLAYFTVPPAPTIISVTPGSGTLMGGTVVTITGTNLSGATNVTFGAAAATALTVLDDSAVTCQTPASPAGNVDVVLTAPGGTDTASGAYTYVPAPVVTSTLTAAGTVGQAFFYQITASDAPTSYAASGLPAGLTIDWATGVISGMADAGGSWSVTIAAANAGGSGYATLVLTIAADQGTAAYSSNDWSGGGCGSGGGLAALVIMAFGLCARRCCLTGVIMPRGMGR